MFSLWKNENFEIKENIFTLVHITVLWVRLEDIKNWYMVVRFPTGCPGYVNAVGESFLFLYNEHLRLTVYSIKNELI